MAERRRPKVLIIDNSPEQPEEQENVAAPKSKSPKEKRRKGNKKQQQEIPVEEGPRLTRREKAILRAERARKNREARDNPNPPAANKARRPAMGLLILFGIIIVAVLAAFVFIPFPERPTEAKQAIALADNCLGLNIDLNDWKLDLDALECEHGRWGEDQQFGNWLLDRQLSYRNLIALEEKLADRGYPSISAGNPYTLMHSGNVFAPLVFAYQPQPSVCILMKLQDDPQIRYATVAVTDSSTEREVIFIESNLADAMFNRQFGLKLAEKMERALRYKVDLFHLQPGDEFTLLYEQKSYETEFKDIGELLAIRYTVDNETRFAFYFDEAFYDEEGYAMKSGFLKAPLKFGRISSPFNLKRADPFNGKVHPHLGTDYAAPLGTPILATADGVITKAEFKGNNGNYVKVRHNSVYTTQYLHMRDFAEGIQPGARVRQGQVLGYVGMTGRTTGPHVCYRFWKNGVQVDHRKEIDFEKANRLDGPELEDFFQVRDAIWEQLDPS